jgi:hypothetical protein
MINDGYVQRTRALALRQVAPETVRKMLENLPGQTDAVLMSSFGISYNTFRKIKLGEAFRC